MFLADPSYLVCYTLLLCYASFDLRAWQGACQVSSHIATLVKKSLLGTAGVRQGVKAGQAEKVLRAHSRDMGQRQQLVHAKLHQQHQGHSPTKAAGEHTHPQCAG